MHNRDFSAEMFFSICVFMQCRHFVVCTQNKQTYTTNVKLVLRSCLIRDIPAQPKTIEFTPEQAWIHQCCVMIRVLCMILCTS